MTTVIIDKGIARLAFQFVTSEKFIAFITAFSQEFEDLNISGLQLLNDRYLDNAEGVNLDIIGEIVGLERDYKATEDLGLFGFFDDPTAEGFTLLTDSDQGGNFFSLGATKQLIGDTLYRTLIRVKIMENVTAMTVDDTTALLSFMFGGVAVHYTLPTNLEPAYEIQKTLSVAETALLDDVPILLGLDANSVTYSDI